jgi:hypothetical protein
MKNVLSLVCEIIEANEPDLKKALDPHIVVSIEKKSFLNEAYWPIELLEKIHPSYFELLLDGYSKRDIQKSLELIKKKSQRLSYEFLKDFLLKKLFHDFSLKPYKFTHAFACSKILFLNSQDTLRLIHLLGIFDIRSFLRTSIDQKLNLDIHNHLSELERSFLKILLKEKEKVTFKKLPLENWDRQPQSLHAMIYLRGLNRLSKTFACVPQETLEDIALRLPFHDKAQFYSLLQKSEDSMMKSFYEDFTMTLDFIEAHVLKTSLP